MSKQISLYFLIGLWMAFLVVLPCAAQESLLQPAEVFSHPANSLPVASISASPLYMTPTALLSGRAVWSFDGDVLRASTAEPATGLLTVSKEADGERRFRFYTAAPDATWGLRHTRLLPPDTPGPVFTVGATGQTAYVLPATAMLVLVDSQGEVIQETALFKDAPYTLERTVLLETQPRTGNVLVAAMRQPGSLGRIDGSEQAMLFCYDPSGRLLWKVELPLPSIYALSADPQGRFIAVASVASKGVSAPVFSTTMLDATGTVLRTLSDGFARIRWAEETTDALLITGREVVWYDLATGQPRQRQAVPNRQQRWIDAVLSSDGQNAVLLAARSVYADDGFEYQQGRLYSLDATGQLRAATTEEAPSKRLALVPAADRFSLIRDDVTRQYRWEDLR